MSPLGSFADLATAGAFALAGLIFGAIYFTALRRTAARLTSGASWLEPAVMTAGRLAGAILLFGFAAAHGAMALLASFIGFLAARLIALRQARSAR